MTATLAAVASSVTGKSLPTVKATGHGRPMPTPDREVVRLALHRAGDLNQTAFAAVADAQDSHVSEAFQGYRPIQWNWLWAQDETFWAIFWPLVYAAKCRAAARAHRDTKMAIVTALQQLAIAIQEDATA